MEIKSVIEYLQEIEKVSSAKKTWIYRGESRLFETPLLAAAFRPGYNKTHEEMQKLFYDATINSISNAQKENFMIFAQHHGIPTCLLDFTQNPLVALYFACSKDSEKDGYIYLLENDMIDVTSYIHDISELPLLVRLFNCDNRLKELYSGISIRTSSPKNVLEYLHRTIESTRCYDTNDNNNALYSINKLQEAYRKRSSNNLEEFLEVEEIFASQGSVLKHWKGILNELQEYPGAAKYTIENIVKQLEGDILLSLVLSAICFSIHAFKHSPRKRVFGSGYAFFQQPFIFSCIPPNVTERINNQSSVFVYQCYEREYSNNGLKDICAVQEINSYYTFKIPHECKLSILKSLDVLGINEHFIFGGFDSVAQIIKFRCQV